MYGLHSQTVVVCKCDKGLSLKTVHFQLLKYKHFSRQRSVFFFLRFIFLFERTIYNWLILYVVGVDVCWCLYISLCRKSLCNVHNVFNQKGNNLIICSRYIILTACCSVCIRLVSASIHKNGNGIMFFDVFIKRFFA